MGAIAEPLLAVIRNPELTIDVRRAAVRAAARVNNGALEIATLAEKKSLDSDLEQAAAAALHASPSRQARERAQQLFPLPPSRDNTPTPPISELAKMKGDAGNGRIVFFSTGTCHKCHVVDGMGREIGPNLTEIGSKLSREAMFESVLYPSAGISHNYEMWTAVLSSEQRSTDCSSAARMPKFLSAAMMHSSANSPEQTSKNWSNRRSA